jgi:phosphonopyruvate decarboxylase
MIESNQFIEACIEAGYRSFTGTPCSYLKPFINSVIDHPAVNFYPSTNEGDAVAFASGLWVGGKKSVVVFQNSGLGNAVNPLTSLNQISKIPVLGIVTLRAEPGGEKDEPQHHLMGKITTELLDLMEIPWAPFPTKAEDVTPALERAFSFMEEKRMPFFFAMSKDSVHEYSLKNKGHSANRPTRTEILTVIHQKIPLDIPVIATTGKTGRELFTIEDHPRNFYMVGSMGCALSMGQGLQLALDRPVCVVDGDGALMMRMGSMGLMGILDDLRSLLHIVLDNGAHDSTGGQSTGSEKIDLGLIAKGCGYEKVYDIETLDEFTKCIDSLLNSKLTSKTFIRMRISIGSPKTLGRPTVTPADVSLRLKSYLEKSQEK